MENYCHHVMAKCAKLIAIKDISTTLISHTHLQLFYFMQRVHEGDEKTASCRSLIVYWRYLGSREKDGSNVKNEKYEMIYVEQ